MEGRGGIHSTYVCRENRFIINDLGASKVSQGLVSYSSVLIRTLCKLSTERSIRSLPLHMYIMLESIYFRKGPD